MDAVKAMQTKRKLTNKKQLEKLVDIMKKNPDIAKGMYKKSTIKTQWEKYADELNSLGPPTRTSENWLKVWTDYKFNVKKKLIHNQKEMKSTGGGPNNTQSLSKLEEDVADFLNLNVTVNPSGREFGLDCSINNEEKDGEQVEHEATTESLAHSTLHSVSTDENVNNINSPDAPSTPLFHRSTSTGRNRVRSTRQLKEIAKSNSNSERIKLLQELTQSQEGFYKELRHEVNEMKTYMKEISEYKRKAYYFKKDTSKELLKIKNKKLEIYEKELQLKKEILELKKKTKELCD